MTNNHLHAKEFIVGAAVGSLLGGVTALLLAPKSGQQIRNAICDTCCDLSERTQDLARRGKSLMGIEPDDWKSKARSAAAKVTKNWKEWGCEEEEEECYRDYVIGGLAGGILGAVAAFLLTPKAGSDIRQNLMDTYDDISDRTKDYADNVTKRGRAFAKTGRSKANKWVEFAKDVLEDLTEGSEDMKEDLVEKAKGLFSSKRANDLLDWAAIGIRVWKGLKSRR